ncbi:MAG: septum formation initiator family protein [Micrococcus sp.]|nr:septum formation initiator family protein [Micrococcus sp.]
MQWEVQVATRRPRVPKSAHRQSAQRSLVTTGAPASRGSYVTGHSAKVIPLDAAPSFHAGDAPAGEWLRTAQPAARPGLRGPGPADAAAAPARIDGTDVAADRAVLGEPAGAEDRAGTAGGQDTGWSGDDSPGLAATLTEAAEAPAPRAPASRKPTLTAAERRAAARRDLLRRARPSGTRASGQGRPASVAARPAVVEPVPARNFSGRSVALLVVLFVAAVLLAPTLRVFLDQQAELRAVQEDIATQQEEQRELTAQIARWDDPAYIRQQARERFNLVMPGEKAYMVIGADEAVEDPVPGPASPSEVNPDMPWADALWDSVVRAGTD